jgi:HUS1 checkpoint protein
LRLTKKDNVPLLSLTIVTNSINSGNPTAGWGLRSGGNSDENDDEAGGQGEGQVRETVVTQDIPIRVLSPASVEGIHEPRCREPDVHITLPNLIQLKSISERFTKLAAATSTTSSDRGAVGGLGPKLVLSANMHGSLRLGVATDALSISSVWTGLINPELDPSHIEGGEEGVRVHPSTRMKEIGGEDNDSEAGWAKVRIDGRDWGRVLTVGRLGGRVIACKPPFIKPLPLTQGN